MAQDSLASVRDQISREVDEIAARCERLSPVDLHHRLDALRRSAELNGMAALEGLARRGAQLALLPGQRIALRHCLAHAADAVHAPAGGDRTAFLAALAARMG